MDSYLASSLVNICFCASFLIYRHCCTNAYCLLWRSTQTAEHKPTLFPSFADNDSAFPSAKLHTTFLLTVFDKTPQVTQNILRPFFPSWKTKWRHSKLVDWPQWVFRTDKSWTLCLHGLLLTTQLSLFSIGSTSAAPLYSSRYHSTVYQGDRVSTDPARSTGGWHLLAMGGIPPRLQESSTMCYVSQFCIRKQVVIFSKQNKLDIFYSLFVNFLRLQEVTRGERNAENVTRKTADFFRKLLAAQLEESRWPRRCRLS